MGYRDDTIERIKEKNSIWNNNLRELVNNEDGDSTEIKLLRQAMRLADLGDGLETPKKGPSFGQQKSRSGRQSPLKDDNQANRYTGGRGDTKIPIYNGAYQRPRSGLYERTDEFGTKTDPSKKLYFEQLKENITAIKNKEYEIPKKDGSSRAEGKLRVTAVVIVDQYFERLGALFSRMCMIQENVLGILRQVRRIEYLMDGI